jgi:two-component system, NarL family, nitrate/nitrite response regulator NarL
MGRRRRLKHMKSLTNRERQIILTLRVGGLSNRDIGRQLSVSEGTVKVHLHKIYKKLGVNGRTALVAMAHTQREELEQSLPLGR